MAKSFRAPDHLPKRGGTVPPGLPRQQRGTTPQMLGRYPDYDVMEHAGHWDETTRAAIERRVREVPPLRFFDATEARCLGAFLDVVLAQDAEPRVPVAEMVDAKLADGRLDGYRYADMPPDPQTWRAVLAGLDHTARTGYGRPFAAIGAERREDVVRELAAGRLVGGAWDRLDVARAWSVVMRAALAAFYSHPWAWNEIGFGGPAYPRGFLRLGGGPAGREPFERPGAVDVDPVRER
jgi:hypothetical protein